MGVLVEEVNLGGQEESLGIQQVARAITQIEQVTQGSAATAEECAKPLPRNWKAQSAALRGVVEDLSRLVGTA